MNIDWSNAPEGYNFHLIGKTKVSEGKFYRAQSDRFRSEAGGYVLYTDLRENLFVITSRPSSPEWNGEGLPPFGTVCEYSIGDTEEWHVCEIKYSSPQLVVFNNERWGDQVSSSRVLFRPLRTAEQIAAEKRLHQIRNALTAINSEIEKWNVNLDCSVAMRATVEAMIDAGYRKCP